MGGVGLRSLTIYCTDLEKTKEFYEVIGLEIHKMQSEWSVYYYYSADLKNDLTLNLIQSGPDKIIKDTSFDALPAFSVEDVVEIIKKLEGIRMPILAPHSVIRHNCDRAIVEDPDGRQIKLRKKKLMKVD